MNNTNLKYFLIVLFLSQLMFSCASLKNISTRQKLNKALIKNDVLGKHFVGFGLYDPQIDQYVYKKNIHQYFTPASNTKILTYYAAINTLGDSITGLRYGFRNDTIHIRGMADPSFMNPEFKYQPVLKMLKSVPDSVAIALIDDPIKNRYGAGWAWDDYLYDFQPEMSSFPIHGNYVSIKLDHDSLILTNPYLFKDLVEVDGNGNHKKYRPEEYNYFIISNDLTAQNLPFRTSSRLVAQILSDTLGRKVLLTKDKAIETPKLLTTIPTDSLYLPFLQRSDNFYAEQLLLMCALHTNSNWDTNAFIKGFIEADLNTLVDPPIWRDGSGLSRYNLVTPASLISILDRIENQVGIEKIKHLFPAGGVSGTIKGWYKGDSPYVFAKTGTLSNNHSISGYLITNSGKTLIFSFMNNNYTNGSAVVKSEMQKIFELIRDTY